MKMQDRYVGCLVGGAIGDALGLPIEGRSYSEISDMFGSGGVSKYLDNPSIRGQPDLPKGTYSDDTQLTLLVAETLINKKGFDPEYFAKLLSEFPSYAISPGSGLMHSAKQLKERKATWRDSGNRSIGVGAAMRAAPFGLFYHDDSRAMAKAVNDCSIITHNTIEARTAALAVAKGVSYLLRNEEFNRERFLNSIADYVTHYSRDFSDKIRNLDSQDIDSFRGNYGGENIVLAALYYFISSPKNFMNTVSRAASSGGDNDSTAAIAGAFSGAFNGINGIPKSLVKGLENGKGGNKKKGLDFIVRVAEKLHKRSLK